MVIGGGTDSYNAFTQRGSVSTIRGNRPRADRDVPDAQPRLKMLRQWGGIVDVTGDRSPILSGDAGAGHLRQLRLGHRRVQGDPRLGLGDGRPDGQGRTRAADRGIRHEPVRAGRVHRRKRRGGGGALMGSRYSGKGDLPVRRDRTACLRVLSSNSSHGLAAHGSRPTSMPSPVLCEAERPSHNRKGFPMRAGTASWFWIIVVIIVLLLILWWAGLFGTTAKQSRPVTHAAVTGRQAASRPNAVGNTGPGTTGQARSRPPATPSENPTRQRRWTRWIRSTRRGHPATDRRTAGSSGAI